jgi:hypothetical protein
LDPFSRSKSAGASSCLLTSIYTYLILVISHAKSSKTP